MATKAHLEGNKRYLAKLDTITIRSEKGKKEIIKAHAESRSESINHFINRAIDNQIKQDTKAEE